MNQAFRRSIRESERCLPSITSLAIVSNTRSTSSTSTGPQSGGFNDINSDQFLKLLINELQNQDPLNPMDNSQMVQQISQIRSIGATDTLTNTLTSLSQNQELVTASGLIGQSITGLADDSTEVKGKVDRVTVKVDGENNSRSIKVHVGNKTMDIKNIRTIVPG